MAKDKTSALKWLAASTKKVFPSVVLLAATGVAVSYISVRFAVASMHLLDSATGASSVSFKSCVIAIAALLALQLSLQVVYTLYDIHVRMNHRNFIQRSLFKTILTRDVRGLADFHSGELINRLTRDVEIINTNIMDVIPGTVSLVSGVAFSFAAMARLDLSLALICLALGPVVLAAASLYGRRMKPLYKNCRRSDGKIRSFMQDCIQNLIAAKAFGVEEKLTDSAGGLQRENYRLNMKRGLLGVAVNVLYYLAVYSAYYFAVAWCAYKIKLGIMTVGAFTAIIQLVGSVQSPFRELAGVIPKFYETCASAERIAELETVNSEETEPSPKLLKNLGRFERLEVKNLTFSYGDKSVLNGASLEAKRGETLAIRGMSGIGKSTFFKLLLGILKPRGGSLAATLGGAEFELSSSTRALFAYVPQGNMLLGGTVRDNIAFFAENPDEEKIIECARAACVWDVISALPNGLDTIVGENGAGLSEGQVQRIAVARALYTDAPVILLDEATSALDEKTELALLNSLRKMSGKTCLMITHRSSAIAVCDRSYTLSNGTLGADPAV